MTIEKSLLPIPTKEDKADVHLLTLMDLFFYFFFFNFGMKSEKIDQSVD